ncbi:MAG: hypothetical protein V1720_22420 [bacterium]
MGLSIHYNGKFNASAFLPDMIREVRDIAEIYNWKYTVFEEEFPAKGFDDESYNNSIYGICFSPPESEPVWLCFLSNGRMSSPGNLIFFGNSSNEDDKKYLYLLSTKTQYAGIVVHKLIIHLLKFLSKKYLEIFNLQDEGHYWETGDEKLLQETFNRYSDLIDYVSSALENIPMNDGETFEKYFERILKIIHYKHKK